MSNRQERRAAKERRHNPPPVVPVVGMGDVLCPCDECRRVREENRSTLTEMQAAAEAKRRRKALKAAMLANPIPGLHFGIDHAAGPDQTKYFVRDGKQVREISDSEYERLAGVKAER